MGNLAPSRRAGAGARPRAAVSLLAMLVAVLALAVAGCGSKSSSGSSGSGSSGNGAASSTAGSGASGSTGSSTTGGVHLAKTKFVLHTGLAFGVFHRYIYKPARAGDFAHPLSHKLEVVKAAAAAAFVVHELKIALADAQADPTLSKLVSPITALQNKIASLHSQVKTGQVDPAALTQDDSSISSIESRSSSSGAPIQEQAPASF